MSSKRKNPKKEFLTPSRKKMFLWGSLALVLTLVVLILFAYSYIDSQVEAWIENGATWKSKSGIYSAPVTLADTSRSEVEHELLKRDYLLVTGAPIEPGQYTRTETGVVVYVRPYTSISGQPIQSRILTWEPGGDSSIELEPLRIGSFSAEVLRDTKPLPLSQLGSTIQNAFLAIEDQRFYSHSGIDITGLSRAMMTNLLHGGIVEGGSTITQQLAKNIFFSSQKTISRKLLEMLAAFSIERRLPKERILERYLNEVYIGQEGAVAIHGIPAAANRFFGKTPTQLTIAEAALLAGLVKAPSSLNPRKFKDRALKRRNLVIQVMSNQGVITESERDAALKEDIKVNPPSEDLRKNPFFIDALKKTAESSSILPDVLANASIQTGINSNLQECAESAVEKGIFQLEKSHPKLKRRKRSPLQAALVSITPHSGVVTAYVGGRDYRINQFDRASQAIRSAGSTIKPFVYLTALDRGLNSYKAATTISILSDEPTTIDLPEGGTWSPENYDHEYRGDVTLRYALERSLNIPAVQISMRIGTKSIVEVIKSFGVADNPPALPSLALGAIDTTLLRLTNAYAALANGGVYVPARLFTSIEAPSGSTLLKSQQSETRISDEAATFVLTDILRGVIDRGTGASIRTKGFTGEAAGKTGTTNDARDAWFIGYTPNLATGVWVGFDDNQPFGLTGGVAAAPIWAEYMKCAQEFIKQEKFISPPGAILQSIDRFSYLPAPPGPDTFTEVFVEGTEPR